MAGAQLFIPNVQFNDSGVYICEAANHKGKDSHHANVSVEGKRNVEWHVSPQHWKLKLTFSKLKSPYPVS